MRDCDIVSVSQPSRHPRPGRGKKERAIPLGRSASVSDSLRSEPFSHGTTHTLSPSRVSSLVSLSDLPTESRPATSPTSAPARTPAPSPPPRCSFPPPSWPPPAPAWPRPSRPAASASWTFRGPGGPPHWPTWGSPMPSWRCGWPPRGWWWSWRARRGCSTRPRSGRWLRWKRVPTPKGSRPWPKGVLPPLPPLALRHRRVKGKGTRLGGGGDRGLRRPTWPCPQLPPGAARRTWGGGEEAWAGGPSREILSPSVSPRSQARAGVRYLGLHPPDPDGLLALALAPLPARSIAHAGCIHVPSPPPLLLDPSSLRLSPPLSLRPLFFSFFPRPRGEKKRRGSSLRCRPTGCAL